jgi:hypothetical protein
MGAITNEQSLIEAVLDGICRGMTPVSHESAYSCCCKAQPRLEHTSWQLTLGMRRRGALLVRSKQTMWRIEPAP